VAVVDPADLDRARGILSSVASEAVFVDRDRRRVIAAVAEGPESLARVSTAIAEAGISIEALGLHRPTLDEVFLTLTGRPAEDAGAGDDVGIDA
jgi:ABC-2 type transport system ATP-binding protein